MNKIEDYQLHLYFGKDEVNTVNNGELLSILNAEAGPCYDEDKPYIDIYELLRIICCKRSLVLFSNDMMNINYNY